MMRRVFFISNCSLQAPIGRAAKFRRRVEFLQRKNWQVIYYQVKLGKEDYHKAKKILYLPLFFKIAIETVRVFFLLKRFRANIVVSSNNPLHLHLIALVSSSFSKIFWVAEFRDGIVEVPGNASWGLVRKKVMRLLEKIIIKRASRVILYKGGYYHKQYFAGVYPKAMKKKFFELPYVGYDEKMIKNIKAASLSKFTIAYSGTLYENWIEPIMFLRAFVEFIRRGNVSPSEVEVRFYVRNWIPKYTEAVNNFNLTDYVKIHNFIPIEELISILKGADLLLYIGGAGKTRPHTIFSKFFLYAGIGGPILALSKNNFTVASLVKEYNLGVVIDEEDEEEIATVLHSIFQGKLKLKRQDLKDKFSIEQPERVFAKVLEEAAEDF